MSEIACLGVLEIPFYRRDFEPTPIKEITSWVERSSGPTVPLLYLTRSTDRGTTVHDLTELYSGA